MTPSKNPSIIHANMTLSIPKNYILSTGIAGSHPPPALINSLRISLTTSSYPKLPSRSGSVAPKNKPYMTPILPPSFWMMTHMLLNCVNIICSTHSKVHKETAKSLNRPKHPNSTKKTILTIHFSKPSPKPPTPKSNSKITSPIKNKASPHFSITLKTNLQTKIIK